MIPAAGQLVAGAIGCSAETGAVADATGGEKGAVMVQGRASGPSGTDDA